MAVNSRRNQRLLAREVLAKRTDADSRDVGDFVGVRPVVSFVQRNASSRFEKGIDG